MLPYALCVYIYSLYFLTGTYIFKQFKYCFDRKVYKCLTKNYEQNAQAFFFYFMFKWAVH